MKPKKIVSRQLFHSNNQISNSSRDIAKSSSSSKTFLFKQENARFFVLFELLCSHTSIDQFLCRDFSNTFLALVFV